MKPRERVAAALDHVEPDRCPFQSTFTPEFAARLRADLRARSRRSAQPARRRQHLRARDRARRGSAADVGGLGQLLLPGRAATTSTSGVSAGASVPYTTPYGVGHYTEPRGHPLADAAALSAYRPPDPNRDRALRGLRSARSAISRRTTGSSASTVTTIFETAWALRGLERLLMDFIEAPDLADEILEIPYRYHLAAAETAGADGGRHDLARRRHRPADRHADLTAALASLPEAADGGADRDAEGDQPAAQGRLPHRRLRLRRHPGADRDRRRRAQPRAARRDGPGRAQARVRTRPVLLGLDGRAAHAARSARPTRSATRSASASRRSAPAAA